MNQFSVLRSVKILFTLILVIAIFLNWTSPAAGMPSPFLMEGDSSSSSDEDDLTLANIPRVLLPASDPHLLSAQNIIRNQIFSGPFASTLRANAMEALSNGSYSGFMSLYEEDNPGDIDLFPNNPFKKALAAMVPRQQGNNPTCVPSAFVNALLYVDHSSCETQAGIESTFAAAKAAYFSSYDIRNITQKLQLSAVSSLEGLASLDRSEAVNSLANHFLGQDPNEIAIAITVGSRTASLPFGGPFLDEHSGGARAMHEIALIGYGVESQYFAIQDSNVGHNVFLHRDILQHYLSLHMRHAPMLVRSDL